MAISDAQKRAVAKYNKANYARVCLQVKPEYAERWKAAAEREGKSLTQFIVDLQEHLLMRQ